MKDPSGETAPASGACCSDSCCGGADARPGVDTREKVREGYSRIARVGVWSRAEPTASQCGSGPAKSGGGCCGATELSPGALATALGYEAGDLAAIPGEANLGLSCGNPTALASLCPGETVLDLGAGGGFDCFLAGRAVGKAGRAIGVDMTPEMVALARRNLEVYRRSTGLDNVELRLGEIENLPVADASVDVVLSNCVLNLSPDKPRVWREIARVLRPGGRVAISDLALLRPLPQAVREDVEALVGCVAGASLVDQIRSDVAAAGLTEIVLTPRPGYVAAMAGAGDPLYRRIVAHLPSGMGPGDFITSLEISARKPA